MIDQRNKDILFLGIKFLSRLLVPFYRLRFRSRKGLRVNLGSGADIVDGFVNVDGNPMRSRALFLDIRNPLPFVEGSVEILFSSNMIEHLFPMEVEVLLKDVHRCLAKGGIARIVVPDLEQSVNAYLEGDADFFPDWPQNCRSTGGRFSNYMFCDGQHRLAFDFGYLRELLVASGFEADAIRKTDCGETALSEVHYAALLPFEERRRGTNLFVEATK